MAKSPNQKTKLLHLARMLLRQTDEDHPLTVAQIIQELERQGIKAERKSVYDDLEALRLFGLDVQSRKGKAPGWFVGAREFELPEVKLLMDAVQSSRFITQKKSDTLIRKLDPWPASTRPAAPAAGVRVRPDQGDEREHLLQRGQAPHRHRRAEGHHLQILRL